MNEENKNLIEAFKVLVKNAGELLAVHFQQPNERCDREESLKQNPCIIKDSCHAKKEVLWIIEPNDTRDLLADRLIKAEELVSQLEFSEARRREYERNHPDLTQCLANNYYQIKDK